MSEARSQASHVRLVRIASGIATVGGILICAIVTLMGYADDLQAVSVDARWVLSGSVIAVLGFLVLLETMRREPEPPADR